MHTSLSSHERHLLVVDDEPGDIELVREAIGTRPIRLHVANRVDHAIRFLERCDGSADAPLPHLVLLDLRLPLGLGTTLLDERRRRPEWQAMPVVVYSADDYDCQRCLALGASEFQQKPATWEAWERMMDRFIATYLA